MYFQSPSDLIAKMEKNNIKNFSISENLVDSEDKYKVKPKENNLEEWLKTPEQPSKAKLNDTEFYDIGPTNATNGNIYNNSIEMKHFVPCKKKTEETFQGDYRTSRDTSVHGNKSIIHETESKRGPGPSVTIVVPGI